MKNYLSSRFILIALLSSCALAARSEACVQIPDSSISLVGSYESGQQVSHGQSADFNLAGCRPFSGHYLVLVNAPIYTDPNFKQQSSPEGELPDERCYIDKSPFGVSKPQDVNIEGFYQNQIDFMNVCLEAVVTDTRGEIDTAAQVNCEITPLDKSNVVAKGPRCAFKIYEDSAFKVSYRLNKACLDKKFITQSGNIRAMDVPASLGIYMASNLTPGNPDYNILTLTSARLTLQPDRKLIPVSTYAGTVGSEWPMQFGAQIDMGHVALNQTPRLHGNPFVYLRTPLMVSNNCKETCKEGICTSPCDFYAPVAAYMTLMKKGVNESQFHGIDYWYQGNLVPPRFIGELTLGRAIPDGNITIGDQYQLVAEFSNPSLTYRTIQDQAKQLLASLIPLRIPLQSAGHGNLEGFEGLGSNMVTEMDGLPNLGHLYEGQLNIDPVIGALSRTVGIDDSWPPFYTTVFKGDASDGANKVFQRIKISFRVASISPFGIVALDQVVYNKDSKIFGSYQKNLVDVPQVKCNPQ